MYDHAVEALVQGHCPPDTHSIDSFDAESPDLQQYNHRQEEAPGREAGQWLPPGWAESIVAQAHAVARHHDGHSDGVSHVCANVSVADQHQLIRRVYSLSGAPGAGGDGHRETQPQDLAAALGVSIKGRLVKL